MPIHADEQLFLDALSLDAPWDLVTTFAGLHRWRPADVIVDRLRRHGIPVAVHAPESCLSVPLGASVTAGGVTCRAKPPSSSLSVPEGRTAPVAERNAAIHDLARILVPINYTREARFAHDPAYTVPPLPGLAVAAEMPQLDAALQRPAQVELMRGQNRFVAALRAATHRVQQAGA